MVWDGRGTNVDCKDDTYVWIWVRYTCITHLL